MHNNARLGISLMIAATITLAVLDGFSRYLAGKYNVVTVGVFRYWFFFAFVMLMSSAQPGGIRRVIATKRPVLQIIRGVMLAFNVCLVVFSFTVLGLVESHAVLACYPLIAAGLSMPLLGERVGWRRWLAIGAGFVGVIIILRPGSGVFSLLSFVPLLAATIFAFYGTLTRLVSRDDPTETSFFWTAAAGAAAMTLIAPFFWDPMRGIDWLWMAVNGSLGILGHYLLIKAMEAAQPATTQPFSYFQLMFVSIIGVAVFNENVDPAIVVGAGIIVAAGLFTVWREHKARLRVQV